jgi:hypothetical protein
VPWGVVSGEPLSLTLICNDFTRDLEKNAQLIMTSCSSDVYTHT